MDLLTALVVAGIMVGTLYGLLGFSLTLMYRTTGVLSFAHAAFALVASYLYAGFECPVTKATSQCGTKPVLPPIPAAITVIVMVTVLGLVVERLVIRPLEKSSSIVRSLATAGVLGLAAAAMLQIYGPVPRFVPPTRQFMPQGGFNIGGVIVDYQRTAIFAVSILLVGILAVLLRGTWFGLGIQAASQHGEAARLVGVRPVVTSRFNWGLAGALSAVAGVLVAPILAVNIGTYAYLLVTAVGCFADRPTGLPAGDVHCRDRARGGGLRHPPLLARHRIWFGGHRPGRAGRALCQPEPPRGVRRPDHHPGDGVAAPRPAGRRRGPDDHHHRGRCPSGPTRRPHDRPGRRGGVPSADRYVLRGRRPQHRVQRAPRPQPAGHHRDRRAPVAHADGSGRRRGVHASPLAWGTGWTTRWPPRSES